MERTNRYKTVLMIKPTDITINNVFDLDGDPFIVTQHNYMWALQQVLSNNCQLKGIELTEEVIRKFTDVGKWEFVGFGTRLIWMHEKYKAIKIECPAFDELVIYFNDEPINHKDCFHQFQILFRSLTQSELEHDFVAKDYTQQTVDIIQELKSYTHHEPIDMAEAKSKLSNALETIDEPFAIQTIIEEYGFNEMNMGTAKQSGIDMIYIKGDEIIKIHRGNLKSVIVNKGFISNPSNADISTRAKFEKVLEEVSAESQKCEKCEQETPRSELKENNGYCKQCEDLYDTHGYG